MPEFLKTSGVTAFEALTQVERAHALYLLHTCSTNDPRRLAMKLRNFYLGKTYGALQEPPDTIEQLERRGCGLRTRAMQAVVVLRGIAKCQIDGDGLPMHE